MKLKHLLLAGSVVICSCTVNPKATQMEVASGNEVLQHPNAVAAFYMQASRLDISFKNTAEEGKPAKWAFTVANSPIEDTRRRFLLLQNSDLFSRTTLVAGKRQNTDLISSIGSDVTDNRVALMQNVGSVAKIAIGLAVSATAPPIKPFTTRFELKNPDKFQPATSTVQDWSAWTHPDIDNLAVQVGPAPVTSLDYQPGLLQPKMNGVFASACRPVIITYTAPNGVDYEWRGKIADADKVEFTAMPRKGKIEYHDQCGSSVTSEKDPTKTTDEIVAAAVTQAAAVKEAYDKAKDE